MLSDAKVAAAVRAVARGTKPTMTLSDPAPRGAGRLVLIAKPTGALWYAQRFVDGRRKLQKLGTYPEVSLADARDKFGGHKPATGRATVGELLDAYLETLEGRPSHKQAKSVFKSARATLGAGRLARDIMPSDIARCLKPSYTGGKRPMAHKHRTFLSAAFRWAMLSSNDYRVSNPRDWGLTHNPVAAVPQDRHAGRAGQRWLSADELVAVLRWAMEGKPGTSRHAIALMLLTGQRVTEILRIHSDHWDAEQQTLHWPTTKTRSPDIIKPHTIPVCSQAVALIGEFSGYLFPGNAPRDYLCGDSVRATLNRHKLSGFTARDFRRTWKTLAGQAGLTKEERDLLQNHGRNDISSKHYDRWEYMPEKRAAIKKWEDWLAGRGI